MTASGGSLLILPRIMTSILACMCTIHRQDYKVFLYIYYFSICFHWLLALHLLRFPGNHCGVGITQKHGLEFDLTSSERLAAVQLFSTQLFFLTASKA